MTLVTIMMGSLAGCKQSDQLPRIVSADSLVHRLVSSFDEVPVSGFETGSYLMASGRYREGRPFLIDRDSLYRSSYRALIHPSGISNIVSACLADSVIRSRQWTYGFLLMGEHVPFSPVATADIGAIGVADDSMAIVFGGRLHPVRILRREYRHDFVGALRSLVEARLPSHDEGRAGNPNMFLISFASGRTALPSIHRYAVPYHIPMYSHDPNREIDSIRILMNRWIWTVTTGVDTAVSLGNDDDKWALD